MLVLHDEFGFGEKRLFKFYEAFEKLYEGISENYLTIEDILKTLEEETGLIIKGWK